MNKKKGNMEHVEAERKINRRGKEKEKDKEKKKGEDRSHSMGEDSITVFSLLQ
jgi:hypothetical protein